GNGSSGEQVIVSGMVCSIVTELIKNAIPPGTETFTGFSLTLRSQARDKNNLNAGVLPTTLMLKLATKSEKSSREINVSTCHFTVSIPTKGLSSSSTAAT